MKNIPLLNHVAIIMDGNRRWAKLRNKNSLAGHKKGIETLKMVIEESLTLKIPYLTVYAFSTENWQRSRTEVIALLKLLSQYLSKGVQTLHDQGVRIRIIGDKQKFSPKLKSLMNKAEEETLQNTKLNLTIALNYGGRQDILQAVEKWGLNLVNNPKSNENNDFSEYLYTYKIPDPDLLIRTGGEKRLSNFLLWEMMYTELAFSDTYWPEFVKGEYHKIIDNFLNRERRYGGI